MSNRTSCAQVHQLPQSHCGDNREGGRAHCFHDCIYICPSCFCEIWAICVSWITYGLLYIYIYQDGHIYMQSWKLCGSSCTWAHDVHGVVHDVAHDVVITGRAHCFHDCTYIYIYTYIYITIYINSFIKVYWIRYAFEVECDLL